MRLNKFIASTGHCSRRQADELIDRGKVLVNNMPAKMGMQVDPENDQVRIKGGPTLSAPSSNETILVAMNKPKGYVCTRNEEQASRTVYDLLPKEFKKLNSIGRLDKDSEGLLLFTNNGELANQMTHPKFGKEKTYIVTVRGQVTEKELGQIRKGMHLLEYKTAPAQATLIQLNTTDNTSTVELKLKEGKKRQIRNIFLALKKPVKKLVRTQFGSWSLGSLKPGDSREVRYTS